MGRIITAGVVGAIIYFVWGMLAWMVLPLHGPTVAALPEERAVADSLKAQNLESGVYIVPNTTDPEAMSNPESEFTKNHLAGPIFSIFYRKEGATPMAGSVLFGGFIIDLLAATLAAALLSCTGACCRGYGARVGFVMGLGVFVALIAHGGYWNWMYFPTGFTIAFMVDVTIGWLLAGLAIAFFVHPKQEASTTPQAAAPTEKPQAKPTPVIEKPIRNEAISLLAALQREARFVDIVKEPLGDYSDEQVGAAARDVLRDCGAVLDRLFGLAPVVDQEEGDKVDIPAGSEGKFQVAGDASGEAKSGSLVHHGWQAKKCDLPKWTGSKETSLIVSPAEIEVQ